MDFPENKSYDKKWHLRNYVMLRNCANYLLYLRLDAFKFSNSKISFKQYDLIDSHESKDKIEIPKS